MSRYPFPRPPMGAQGQPQAGPSRQPYYPQQPVISHPNVAPGYPYGLPPNPYQNASGGYNPYQAPMPNMPITFPQPYAQPIYQPPSFGQSLFKPTATPEGYAYSSAYVSANAPEPTPPPAKKQKLVPTSSVPIQGNGVKAWRNCSVPGCKFLGPGEEVEIHEGDRHLIFPAGYKVERSEEEERFAKRNGPPPPIEGTNITLQTPEDIEKWITERKSKWPSAKRIAEKEAEHHAAVERGDIPARGRGRGRGGRGGLAAKRAMDPAARAEDWGRPAVDEETRRGESSRGRGGRGWGGDVRGRGRGRGGRGGGHQGERDGQRESRDEGWPRKGPQQQQLDPDPPRHDTPKTDAATVLAGVDDYDSDTLSDAESSSTSSSSTLSDSSSSSGNDSEDENVIRSTARESAVASKAEILIPEPSTRPVCKYFAKSGRCNRGNKCQFAHIKSDAAQTGPTEKKQHARQPPAKKANPFERPSMLGALLADPINNTLSQLSQTIRFLVANNMLEGVELNPGDAEAAEKERNKVMEVDQSKEDETVGETTSDFITVKSAISDMDQSM